MPRISGRVLAWWFVLLVVLFVLSTSGQENGPWRGGPSWLGTTAWVAFYIAAIGFLLAVVLVLVRRVRDRG